MSLLDGFKANKAIAVLLAEEPGAAGEAREAAARLKQMGGRAVPRLIDALEEDPANRNILSLLAGLLENQSLHYYIDGLAHHDKRVVSSVMHTLARSSLYDVNRLFELFDDPDIPKNALLQILVARKDSINLRKLLDLLKDCSKNTRQLVFRVLEFAARDDALPHLLPYLESKDPDTRVQVTRVIGRFDNNMARDALLRTTADPHKTVRLAAIEGIANLTVTVPSKPVCELLKDGDITIQGKAVEALIRINDPNTVQYLIDVLQDDSEYVRRAAVEVLNEIGDHRAIKDLLNALRDKDWWIRVRAADALGSIGGPKVIDAVLQLIRDEDEFLRRTAVEILNNIRDERAVTHLVTALEDSDWWVRERAADALAELGDARAVPPLVNMMIAHAESEPVALRALARISDNDTVQGILTHAEGIEESRRAELLEKVAETDMTPPPTMDSAPTRMIGSASGSLNTDIRGGKTVDSRDETMVSIDRRTAAAAAGSPQPASKAPAAASPDVSVIDAAALAPGHVIAGRYKVLKKVGEGAFGVVVKVEDLVVHEEIILKFLHARMGSDEHVIKRFIHELRYARKITHQNVIRIFDFVTFGKSYAISMEYFDSHSLAHEIKHKTTSDHARMVKILLEVCNGLGFAHRAGVVHRDIKPANILIDDQDQVKLVDFGLAAAASTGDSRLTRTGILVGTPTYMAPEQVRDQKIDARTDIYSLGILMYEIFTGRPPYRGKDSMAILFQHVEGKAPEPASINPAISADLNKVIVKAMAIDPKNRFQSVDELRSALAMLAARMSN